MDDRERVRRAVEDGEYLGDVAPLLVAECRRLRAKADQYRAALIEIDRRIREDTGVIREVVNEHGDGEAKRRWQWAIYGSAVHAQVMAGIGFESEKNGGLP